MTISWFRESGAFSQTGTATSATIRSSTGGGRWYLSPLNARESSTDAGADCDDDTEGVADEDDANEGGGEVEGRLRGASRGITTAKQRMEPDDHSNDDDDDADKLEVEDRQGRDTIDGKQDDENDDDEARW